MVTRYRIRLTSREARAITHLFEYVEAECIQRGGARVQRTKDGSLDLRTNRAYGLYSNIQTLRPLVKRIDPRKRKVVS